MRVTDSGMVMDARFPHSLKTLSVRVVSRAPSKLTDCTPDWEKAWGPIDVTFGLMRVD